MPGVITLLDHLKNCGIPMALATSSSKEYLSLKTSKKHSSVFSSKEQKGTALGIKSDVDILLKYIFNDMLL